MPDPNPNKEAPTIGIAMIAVNIRCSKGVAFPAVTIKGFNIPSQVSIKDFDIINKAYFWSEESHKLFAAKCTKEKRLLMIKVCYGDIP